MRRGAAIVLVVAALCWGWDQSRAQMPDPDQVARQRAFLRLFFQTRECMRGAARSAMRTPGVTDVKAHVLAACSTPIASRMQADGVPADSIRGTLNDMADRALREARDPSLPLIIL